MHLDWQPNSRTELAPGDLLAPAPLSILELAEQAEVLKLEMASSFKSGDTVCPVGQKFTVIVRKPPIVIGDQHETE